MALSTEEVQLRLLDFYSGRVVAHGTYLLAIALVFFAATQLFSGVEGYKVFPNYLIAVATLTTLATSATWVFIKTLSWGLLAGSVLPVSRFIPNQAAERIVKGWSTVNRIEGLTSLYAYQRTRYFQLKMDDSGLPIGKALRLSRVSRAIFLFVGSGRLKYWVLVFAMAWGILFYQLVTSGLF